MDDFKGTFGKITRGVAKSSSNLVKSAKLSMNLSSEEENLKKIYMDIGKKVHEIYLYGGSLGKVFDERYQAIVESEAKIRDLRERLNLVKGAQTCPKCGKLIDREATFCPKCGSPVGEGSGAPDVRPLAGRSDAGVSMPPLGEIRPAVEAKPAEPAPPAPVCAACGAEAEPGAKFCLGCGRILR